MAMVCARFTDAEVKMLDALCTETKKSRSDIIRQLVAQKTVPILQSDSWTLTFFHIFGVTLTQIKYALRLPSDEMWTYISQKCKAVTVKHVGAFYIVTLLRNDAQLVAKVSANVANNEMLSECAKQIEDGIISEIYEAN